MMEGGYSILVVDDDAISNFVTVRHLKQFKTAHTIQDFINPFNALEFLNSLEVEKLPDYILLDINMPSLSGWDFVDRLKVMGIFSPKVFMLTSSIFPEDYEKSENYPLIKGFIIKPLDKIKIQNELKIE